MTRFKVVFRDDLPEAQREWQREFCYVLIDTQDDSVVASDCGEPEDNCFSRDWNWVAPLLNQLDAERVLYREALEDIASADATSTIAGAVAIAKRALNT